MRPPSQSPCSRPRSSSSRLTLPIFMAQLP
jgi:hypothetical protein